MTPLRSLLIRVIVLALVVFALTVNVANADDGGMIPGAVPYDPGLPGDQPPPPDPLPEPPPTLPLP